MARLGDVPTIRAVLAAARRPSRSAARHTHRRPLLPLGLLAILVVVVSGCIGAPEVRVGSDIGGNCEQAFAWAEAQPSAAVTATDLDAAVRTCATLAQWTYAAERHPGGLHLVEPLTFLAARCADVPAGLGRYATCMGLRLSLATPSPTPRPTKRPRATPRPTSKPDPRHTPRPTNVPSNGIPSITGADFGPGVQVSWYSIMGDSPQTLQESILARGPSLAWLGGRAEAMTTPSVRYRFAKTPDGSGGCQIVAVASPAIAITFTVDLPRWAPPRASDPATVRWWSNELRTVVRHERTHVRLLLAATRKANKVLKTSTCGNWSRKLAAVWRETRRENCTFDMDEYGRASGLSLKACMRG